MTDASAGTFPNGWVPKRVSLLLVGRMGSGKSAIGHWLASQTRCPYFEIGGVVRSSARARGLPPLDFADDHFAVGDRLDFVKRVVLMSKSAGGPCIISGARRPEELDYLRRVLVPALAVAIDPPQDVRLQRVRARKRDGETELEIQRREKVEEEWGVAKAVRQCDLRVENVDTIRSAGSQCLNHWISADRMAVDED